MTPTPTNIYNTAHLDSVPAAYRHHLSDNLTANWKPFLDGLFGLSVVGAASWLLYHHMDEFAGAAMVGVLIVMAASLASDVFAWPLFEAIRSQKWYGPDRIVHRQGVGPVQVADVDTREELSGTWVLVGPLGSLDTLPAWVPLGELAPTPDGITGEEAER